MWGGYMYKFTYLHVCVLCQPFRLTATALKLVVSALKGEHPMMCKAASEPSSKELG